MKSLHMLLIAAGLTVIGIGASAQSLFENRARLDDRPRGRDIKQDNQTRGIADSRPRLDDRPNLRDRKSDGFGPDRLRDDPGYWDGRSRLDDRRLRSSVQNLGEDRTVWDNWWQDEPVEEPVFVVPFRPWASLPNAEVCLTCGELPIELTVEPLLLNGVLYLAATDYFAALGTNVNYNATYRSAIALLPDGRWLVIPLGHSYFYVDQQLTLLAQPTAVANNILMVPVRALSEKLGFGVKWDPTNRTAVLVPPQADAEAVPETPGEAPATQPE